MLEIARLRGVPQERPFSVAGHPTLQMVPADSRICAYLFWLGIDGHEAGGPAWWARLVSTHRSALEIGANVGVYTLVGAASASHVRYRAFEPNPTSFDALRRNLELNALSHVEVVQAAVVGRRTATKAMLRFPDRDRYGASSGAFLEGALDVVTPSERDTVVSTVSVADIIEGVDLIKLDIEGLETEVLEAVRDQVIATRPTILVEVRDDARSLQRFLADLVSDTDYLCVVVTRGNPAKVPAEAVLQGRLQRNFTTRDVTLIAPERAAAITELGSTEWVHPSILRRRR